MPFDPTQVRALSGKLSARHVRTRESQGKTLAYIEGWHAIAEANRIFGYDAWDSQTLANRCVWQGQAQGQVRSFRRVPPVLDPHWRPDRSKTSKTSSSLSQINHRILAG